MPGSGPDARQPSSPVGAGPNVALPTKTQESSLSFVENEGQISNDEIRFVASAGGMEVGFGDRFFELSLIQTSYPVNDSNLGRLKIRAPELAPIHGVLVRVQFESANVVEPVGARELSVRNHYLFGNDPASWHTNVRSFAGVTYPALYDGVDLRFYGTNRGPKYEFSIVPHADLAKIELSYAGIDGLQIDGEGALVLQTALGKIRDEPPFSFQERGHEVDCRFEQRARFVVGFRCLERDPSLPLTIDPLAWATFLGGSQEEQPLSVGTDSYGNVYVVGYTVSPDFPVSPGAFDVQLNGSLDAFLVKLDSTGSTRLYGTYIGGSGGDVAWGVALDAAGNIIVVGGTGSADFPTTPSAIQRQMNGSGDAFILKLSPSGTGLLFGSYLGGNGSDDARSVAIDDSGMVYVTGPTTSTDFPVTAGAWSTVSGFQDAYAAKVDPTAGSLVYASYIGGGAGDFGGSIAVDAQGSAYVAGETSSSDFNVTVGAFDTTLNQTEGFVVKLDPSGTTAEYSTFIGGDSDDFILALDIDAVGNAYVVGQTHSTNFPTTAGALNVTLNGGDDAFVAKLDPYGKSLRYGTYLGGSNLDIAHGLSVDSVGNAYVTGDTLSSDFRMSSDAFDAELNGTSDAFIVKLDRTGSRLDYGTYLGGNGDEDAYEVSVDSARSAYVVGATSSPDFPVTPNAFSRQYGMGASDGIVVKLDLWGATNTPPALSWTGEPNYVADGLNPENGSTATFFVYRVTYSDSDGDPPAKLQLLIESPLGSLWRGLNLSVSVWMRLPYNFTAGATYSVAVTLPPGVDWWYRFNASDGRDWAIGPPAAPTDAPDVVSDEPPTGVAATSGTTGHIGEIFQFDGLNSTDDHGIVSYDWTFGDGASASGSLVTHSYSSRGTFSVTLVVRDAANQQGSDSISVEVQNRPPVSDAGPDQSANKGQVIVLNGTTSYDPDGDSLTFGWTQTAGPSVALTGAGASVASFTPVISGLYVFSLGISDGWGGTAGDIVNVSVIDRTPVANAGPNMTARKRIGVVLDGTASFDPDGDPLTFAWTERSGPSVILSDATSDRPSFVPSSAGVYVFRLTVDDGDGGISSDEVTVVVPNGPPVAVAGPDTKARKYQTASLDASGSWDPDGDPLTFLWTQVQGPGSGLQGSDTKTPTFVPSAVGTYVFRVMVGDGDGGSSLDETSVYVWGLPPIATLVVSPVVAHLGELVRLDARGSVDPDGEVASYSFGFGDGTSSVEPTGLAGHVFGSLGVYNVSVRVTDIDGNASWAWSSVTVVAEEAQTVQVNWKPWIALVFVAVLAGIGWWSTSKSPHGSAKDFRTRARAFLAFTAPFLAAEAATGVFSMATGQLTIPPLIGSGVVVDGGILGFGIAVSILRGRRS